MRRIVLLGLIACRPPQPAPVSPPVSHAAARPPLTRALPGYPAPLEPRATVCTVSGTWDVEQPRTLHLAPDGFVFATVHGPAVAEVALSSSRGNAFAEVLTDHVRMWGFVPAEQITLHAARPLLIADYVAPGPGASMRLRGATRHAVSVELTLPAHVTALVPAQALVPCDALSLDTQARFSPRDAIAADPGTTEMLADQQLIEVTVEPGESPVAELKFDAGDTPMVDVLERRGTTARVVVRATSLDPSKDLAIVGWVDASLLRSHAQGFGGSWATGGGSSHPIGRSPSGSRRVRCENDVPLVVELLGARRLVGSIRPNVELDVMPGTDDLVEVLVRTGHLEPADGARFLVKRSIVARCTADGG